MNRAHLKRQSHLAVPSDTYKTKILRKSNSKRSFKTNISCINEASKDYQSSDEGGATYLSDTFLSGVFTPYSTTSNMSKVTGLSYGSRRRVKEQRKGLQRYNLRPIIRWSLRDTCHVSRSMKKSQKITGYQTKSKVNKLEKSGTKSKKPRESYFLDEVTEEDLESTYYCSQSIYNEDFFFNSNFKSNSSRSQSKKKTQKSTKQKEKKEMKSPKVKKVIAPVSTKVFFEDKLTRIPRAFTLYEEKHLKFLKDKHIASQQKKQLGLEDDHASDTGVVEQAKKLLKNSLKDCISEYLRGECELTGEFGSLQNPEGSPSVRGRSISQDFRRKD
ncbi:UNKNOWN [Stylonychia lemnae]|uniref:Uncharacterized protein n=1 Tax=Stylonychia lemnae TaxID=5949 RepID=A0A078B4D3_STYLE|nr:UNKNOWN [Stylonychia lemnae]|eukprot:CDW88067.1 UNKNOWN [Stylonychia lemnae]